MAVLGPLLAKVTVPASLEPVPASTFVIPEASARSTRPSDQTETSCSFLPDSPCTRTNSNLSWSPVFSTDGSRICAACNLTAILWKQPSSQRTGTRTFWSKMRFRVSSTGTVPASGNEAAICQVLSQSSRRTVLSRMPRDW